MSDAQYPVFDADGKYLYFAASTDSGQSLQPDIHSFSRPVTRAIYLAVLAKDEPSPFAPESDEEKGTEEKKAEEGGREKAGRGKNRPRSRPQAEATGRDAGPKAVTVKIDFDGILQRILAIPMPARNYVGLHVGQSRHAPGRRVLGFSSRRRRRSRLHRPSI